MIWLGLAYIVIGLALVAILAVAPHGYEDERGFHYGEPDE